MLEPVSTIQTALVKEAPLEELVSLVDLDNSVAEADLLDNVPPRDTFLELTLGNFGFGVKLPSLEVELAELLADIFKTPLEVVFATDWLV
ncbi:hypothetical protein HG530_004432 [Fusarium avenaceum]|nr:hypothetical protein HG530_004432 [Fusarium avenaceum]